MEPAEKANNVKGYNYLCRSHHMILDGRARNFAELGRQRASRIIRTCPVCRIELNLSTNRAKSRLNFCSTSHRSLFYHPKGRKIGAPIS